MGGGGRGERVDEMIWRRLEKDREENMRRPNRERETIDELFVTKKNIKKIGRHHVNDNISEIKI